MVRAQPAMMGAWRNWRRRRLLRHTAIAESTWHSVWAELPILHRLGADDERRLRELSLLFLHEKTIEAAAGLQLTDTMRVAVAAQACLPILNLGLDWYDGWHAVILYPAEFVPRIEWQDEAGVVHVDEEVRSGEAWLHGPVILSWEDVQAAGAGDGYNVVIHELAHKLDALTGATDGLPPLHRNMAIADWSNAFGTAFADHTARVDAGEDTFIDPYAAEAPEEFFAVVSELFFEMPHALHGIYPEIYGQLQGFYRQDPMDRFG